MAKVFQRCKEDKKSPLYPCERKRCKHPWTVRYRTPGGRQGRQLEESFPTFTEADGRRIEVEGDSRVGKFIDPKRGKTLVHVFAAEWQRDSIVGDTTRRRRQSVLDNHILPELGGKQIGGISAADGLRLQKAMKDKGLSPSTVNENMRVANALMNHAVLGRRIQENPFVGVKPLKSATGPVDEDEIPKLEEVERIAAYIEPEYELAVWLMAGAGLRPAEAMAYAAEWKRNGFIRIRFQTAATAHRRDCKKRLVHLKSRADGEYRDVPLADVLADRIAAHVTSFGVERIEGSSVLFARQREYAGTMHSSGSFGHIWGRALKAANMENCGYTPHSLRHFFASTAIAGNIPLLEVSRWLGHSSIKITGDIYGHLVHDAAVRGRTLMQAVLTRRPLLAEAA